MDLSRAAALVGAPLEKTDAAAVRASTGFIGGVSPLGQYPFIETYLDRNLLRFGLIWAAAGTPNHVFAVSPTALAAALVRTNSEDAPPRAARPMSLSCLSGIAEM